MTQPPLPTNLGAARRWVQNTNRHINETGRRLGSATIGAGGLRVYRDGGLSVDGNLTIVNGDLELAGGTVSSDMLKEQLRPQLITNGLTSWSDPNNAKWVTVSTLEATPPAWANHAIIFATANIRFAYRSTLWLGDGWAALEEWAMKAYLKCGDQTSPTVDARLTALDFESTCFLATSLECTPNKPIRLETRLWVYKPYNDYFFKKNDALCNPSMLIVWGN